MYAGMGICSYIRMTVLLLHLRCRWRLSQHATFGFPRPLTLSLQKRATATQQLLPLFAAVLDTERPLCKHGGVGTKPRGKQAEEPANTNVHTTGRFPQSSSEVHPYRPPPHPWCRPLLLRLLLLVRLLTWQPLRSCNFGICKHGSRHAPSVIMVVLFGRCLRANCLL